MTGTLKPPRDGPEKSAWRKITVNKKNVHGESLYVEDWAQLQLKTLSTPKKNADPKVGVVEQRGLEPLTS